MKTTIEEIYKFKPCFSGFKTFVENHFDSSFGEEVVTIEEIYGSLFDFEKTRSISILEILNSNGAEDAFWALRTQKYKDYCLILADVAESVLHIFEDEYPEDKRPRDVINAMRKYNAGSISHITLKCIVIAAIDVFIDIDPAAKDVNFATIAATVADAHTVATAAANTKISKQWETNEKILRFHLEKA